MRLKRIMAFTLSALLMLLNMTNIVMATEQSSTIKVGIGEKIVILEQPSSTPTMKIADENIASISYKADTDGKWKVIVEGKNIGITTVSLEIWGEATRTYTIEVIEGSTIPPRDNNTQRINANKLLWTPVSDKDQLGGADDFSGIIFNEFKNFNETGGPVAAKKIDKVGIITFEAGTSPAINQFSDIIIPEFNVGVMSQESVLGKKTVITNGDAVVGTGVDTNNLDMGHGAVYKKQQQIDSFLKEAKADLVKLNEDLWNRKNTAEIVDANNVITLNCVKGINIFEIDFSSLTGKSINFDYPKGAEDCTIVIKVKGNTIKYNDTFIKNIQFYDKNTDSLANRVIWTFDPAIKNIEIKSTRLCGSLLAPNADITFSADGYSAINGTIIANGLDGSGTSSELHWVGPFKGKLGSSPINNTGRFEFNKKDDHGDAVKGAEFALYQGNEEKINSTSDENGLVSFTDIEAGLYTLKEKAAPNGYDISEAEVEVIVSNEGTVTFKKNDAVKTQADIEALFINKVSTVNFSFAKVESGTSTAIPNVEFNLKSSDNKIVKGKSGVDGIVSFENIELGNYTLEEITPSGYEKAGPWKVNVTKDGASIDGKPLEKIENTRVVEKTGSFKFNKKDNHGNLLKGAEFTLYQGSKVYNTTSTDKGSVAFNNIKEGTYKLKETKAPEGYEVSTSEVEVTVTNDGTVTFEESGVDKTEENLDTLFINNVSTTNFSFNKVISGTSTAIPNVEFNLKSSDNKIVKGKSSVDGIVSFENIELGNYTLEEITPSGYEEAGPWMVNVTKDGASIDGKPLKKIENKKIVEKTGAFQFNKKDNHGLTVKGAIFGLYQNGEEKYTSTSTGKITIANTFKLFKATITGENKTSDGIVSFNGIKQGTYTLKETNAPEGFDISTSEVEVTVDKDGVVIFQIDGKEITLADLSEIFVNNVSKVDFNFNKVISGTDIGIEGVEFKLLQGDKLIDTERSNANGVVTFKGIELGTYTLVETRPFGYKELKPVEIKVTEKGAFVVNENSTTELIKIENVEVIGNFQFNKLDNHEKVVKEARFALFQDGVEKYNSTSTDNGLVSFNNIKEGSYTLKETDAPNGYEISNTELEVTVDKDGKVTFKLDGQYKELAELDSLYVNNIIETKVDFGFNKVENGTNAAISNVEFKLVQGNEEIAKAISDENGIVSFENIELGTYTLVETTPSGYKEAGPWTINVTKEGASFIDGATLTKIENEKIDENVDEKLGSFQFNKKDNHGNLVKGAEFELYKDGKKYTTISTDTGVVAFNDIEKGTYTLKETKAPNGYEISKTEVEVIVDSDGKITFKKNGVVKTEKELDLLYVNKLILGDISFTKYINDKKSTLTGAEFELLMNGERYGSTVFSDANGLVIFLNVKPGEYKIREVSSHSKYFKTSDKVIDVTVDDNGISSLTGEAKVEAETLFINKVENSIQFIKYSDENSVLSNATFELLKGTEVIATSISDKNGVVRFKNILPGEYIVREKSAPKGYIKSDVTRKLVVKDNGEISIIASEIKEWEEAFKNKPYKSEEGSIGDNNTDNTEDNTTVPQTSDETNVIFPVLAAFLSLAGIFLIRKIK